MANWPGNDAVFALCKDRIKQFEGYSAKPYRDSAGVPTIGWGTIRYPNGKTVTMSDPAIGKDYAEQCLTFEMTQKAAILASHLEKSATVHQAGAMLSLAYNIGVQAFLGSSVLRQFNAGKINAAAKAFEMWDKAHVDGKLVVVAGLLKRRKEEEAMFLAPD
ncbi:MAG TPA: lysozyme [Rhizomicrobium sp.]|jgi:lysozyme